MSGFNKEVYDREFKKKNYKQFKVDLPIKEKDDLDDMLKMYNISKSEFLKNSIKKFKEEKKMKKYVVTCDTTKFVKDEKGWRYDGLTIGGTNSCEKIFDTIEEATKFYDSIELDDDIQKYSRYSESKCLYEVDEKDIDEDEVNLNDAIIIKDDSAFTDYH